MKVIIGAGPAGLYTAIKLAKAGIRDLVLYDPRAGVYTRPGHVNGSAFTAAAEGTGTEIDPSLMRGTRVGHIKDLERALYAEVVRLGITIDRRRFVKLSIDRATPGLIVADGEGTEEFISADYIFDCTGTKRQVIHAVNAVFSADPPFKFISITDVPVSRHFIAYVKVPNSELSRLPNSLLHYNAPSSLLSSSLIFARNIVKLRNLGWNELKFPRAYNISFGEKSGKHKICLYLHAPDGLTREHYDLWVKTVLECYTPLSINYERLPDSKPRFLSFDVKAEMLDKPSFVKTGWPTIIPLGDAQIDFDYALGHGIEDGMHRIDTLLEHMVIDTGKIDSFDNEKYFVAIQQSLRNHRDAMIDEANKIREHFEHELSLASIAFQRALETTDVLEEKSVFRSILREIDGRLSLIKARTEFIKNHNAANELIVKPSTMSRKLEKLRYIHTQLLTAQATIPASFSKEHKDILSLLPYLAGSYKTLGNTLLENGRYSEATEAYKKALEIYFLPALAGRHAKNELILYSNLTILYIKESKHSEAIAAAKTALEVYSRCLH